MRYGLPTLTNYSGDPGVGKTAIAEGLALRIVENEVPESITTRVFSLDLGALLASTACQSSYELVCGALSTTVVLLAASIYSLGFTRYL